MTNGFGWTVKWNQCSTKTCATELPVMGPCKMIWEVPGRMLSGPGVAGRRAGRTFITPVSGAAGASTCAPTERALLMMGPAEVGALLGAIPPHPAAPSRAPPLLASWLAAAAAAAAAAYSRNYQLL
ncbi:hypothetical protein VOLCADRAFT_100930 [Volvox carteri f. nagariensis]|uniref:Uncharacterized protein n=1 Tax=Volvox carteri f. nagariensis TaxID=3068 RepID=D8ULC8_VOLCA|nr:uncharacterized protein VOLCADRAFT_100930 [Volvox carteri f. nagariensis]EFJ39471.1 hypothetical protein VOLCADRAFT_100930 [Volvox carteri f. nagariensis]|eukprot:XP_002959464.1 hypothetical protein VOLCADRAFT_100930 [Volvox carteri f. nagariensis]